LIIWTHLKLEFELLLKKAVRVLKKLEIKQKKLFLELRGYKKMKKKLKNMIWF
jgi:hypothetical protein